MTELCEYYEIIGASASPIGVGPKNEFLNIYLTNTNGENFVIKFWSQENCWGSRWRASISCDYKLEDISCDDVAKNMQYEAIGYDRKIKFVVTNEEFDCPWFYYSSDGGNYFNPNGRFYLKRDKFSKCDEKK